MKYAYYLLILPLVLMSWLTACSDQEDIFELPLKKNSGMPIVAKVGNTIIFDSDVDAELQQMPAALKKVADTPEIRQRIEDILIRRAVLAQQAVVQGLDLNPNVFSRIQRSRNDILINAFKNKYLNNLPLPTKEALHDYYDTHQRDFSIPEQIHAAHILVRKKKDADAMYKLLKKDASQFANMAMKHSLDDSNSSRGGDLNWFPRGIMAKSFEKVAFALKKEGDISAPVKTNSGWHIIQLKGRKAGSKQLFSEAKKEIIHVLQHQALEAWIASLVKNANIHRQKNKNKNSINMLEDLSPSKNHTDESTPALKLAPMISKEKILPTIP